MKDEIRTAKALDDLMDQVRAETLRKDIVYTMLIKAWDIGYCEGAEDVREGMREWANNY